MGRLFVEKAKFDPTNSDKEVEYLKQFYQVYDIFFPPFQFLIADSILIDDFRRRSSLLMGNEPLLLTKWIWPQQITTIIVNGELYMCQT